jgi:hypothetical protein
MRWTCRLLSGAAGVGRELLQAPTSHAEVLTTSRCPTLIALVYDNPRFLLLTRINTFTCSGRIVPMTGRYQSKTSGRPVDKPEIAGIGPIF